MALSRTPSQALINALGWDVLEEIDHWLQDAAEEARAERRRLEATRQYLLYSPGREADMLRRMADVEYDLRLDIHRAGQRVRDEIRELKVELRRLRESLPPRVAHG